MAVGIRGVAACLFAIASVLGSAVADDRLDEIRVDYAYYSPPSLVLKRFGWLEESFKADGTAVRWVLSQGSNRALEYLAGGGVDFGSTAGLAALLARANDNPIRTVYVYSRPEWTALAVRRDSPLRSVADLKGRKIAATKGTDPYLFLLRSLRQFNVNRAWDCRASRPCARCCCPVLCRACSPVCARRSACRGCSWWRPN